jgi:hypothetical protein
MTMTEQATLMARLSSQLTAPALEWRIDPRDWPTTAERHDGRPIGGLILAIGVAWLALALRDLVAGGSQVVGLGASGGYLALGIGTALALWGCRILVRRQTIRIDDSGVNVQVRHMLGMTSWSEPLANYRGVVWRTERVRRRDLQLIELSHEEPSKTLTLFSSTGDRGAEGIWQAWAQRLGLAPMRCVADASALTGASEAGLASSPSAHGA